AGYLAGPDFVAGVVEPADELGLVDRRGRYAAHDHGHLLRRRPARLTLDRSRPGLVALRGFELFTIRPAGVGRAVAAADDGEREAFLKRLAHRRDLHAV